MHASIDWNNQQYLNIETYRKTGVGVKTPVWFVRNGDKLFVRTIADSGKVKRIRNNSNVNIAACKSDGALLSEWVPANARIVSDPEIHQQVDRLLDQKYGLMKKMFALASAIQGKKYTVLEIYIKE
jgi:uncharacterized protein